MKKLSVTLVLISMFYVGIFFVGYPIEMNIGKLSKTGSGWSYAPTSQGILGMIRRSGSYEFRCDSRSVTGEISAQNIYWVGMPLYFVQRNKPQLKDIDCGAPDLVIKITTREWVLVSLLRS